MSRELWPMKHFTFDHHWDAIKARLKQRYAQLTDDDLAFVEGKGEELLANIRQKVDASVEDFRALLVELHDESAEKWRHVIKRRKVFARCVKAVRISCGSIHANRWWERSAWGSLRVCCSGVKSPHLALVFLSGDQSYELHMR